MFHPKHYAEHDPDRLAFRMCTTGEDVTFSQLEDRSNQGANLFRNYGAETGSHIVILMENRREFLETCFAADRAGLYYTTISNHLSKNEILYIIEDCNAQIVVTSDKFASIAATLKNELSPDIHLFMVGEASPGFESWNEIAGTCSRTPILDEIQGLDMLYSSGTTGRPKGIKWAFTGEKLGSRTMLIDLLGDLFGYGENTRYLCPAPLYHAAPLRHTMVTIKSGGSAFIISKFDAQEALAIIEQEQITHSQWVPTMFVRLLKLPNEVRAEYDMSSMKMVVHAAAPCPIDVKHQMIDWWGPIINEYYAGTENNGFVAITSEEWLNHEGSVGTAKLGILHICNENGVEVPIGSEGEVFFENGHQFEYYNDPEKTAASTNASGWTTLGDIGRLDSEGYLYLTDRKSFVIISGGVNIYPQETENVLLGHPSILDAAVIGVPSEDFGEEVKAVVQLVSDVVASPELEEKLIKFCRERISTLNCPKSVDFRETLPREATGKLYKRRLRDEYWKKA